MVPATSGVTCLLRAEILREALYGACTETDVAFATARLSPEPLRPLVTPLRVTAEGFGSVPRAYIETARDRALSLEAQRAMHSRWPCEPVFTLDTDHSAFLSQPDALARILISI
jgi:hypothetical protein